MIFLNLINHRIIDHDLDLSLVCVIPSKYKLQLTRIIGYYCVHIDLHPVSTRMAVVIYYSHNNIDRGHGYRASEFLLLG